MKTAVILTLLSLPAMLSTKNIENWQAVNGGTYTITQEDGKKITEISTHPLKALSGVRADIPLSPGDILPGQKYSVTGMGKGRENLYLIADFFINGKKMRNATAAMMIIPQTNSWKKFELTFSVFEKIDSMRLEIRSGATPQALTFRMWGLELVNVEKFDPAQQYASCLAGIHTELLFGVTPLADYMEKAQRFAGFENLKDTIPHNLQLFSQLYGETAITISSDGKVIKDIVDLDQNASLDLVCAKADTRGIRVTVRNVLPRIGKYITDEEKYTIIYAYVTNELAQDAIGQFRFPELSGGVYRVHVEALDSKGTIIDTRLVLAGRSYIPAKRSATKAPPSDETIYFTQFYLDHIKVNDTYRVAGLSGDIREDLKTIKAQGFDGIRIIFFWRDLEPIPGFYDFSRVEAALAAARKAGMILNPAFFGSSAYLPIWLWDDEMLDQNGNPPDTADHRSALVPSAWALKVNESQQRLLSNFVGYFRSHENIREWSVYNRAIEWGFPATRSDRQFFDYSQVAQEAFRNYLEKNKGCTLDDLGRRYSSRFGGWEEVLLPQPQFEGIDTRAVWQDFIDFNVFSLNTIMQKNLQTVSEQDGTRPLTSLGFGGYFVIPGYLESLKKYKASGLLASVDLMWGQLISQLYRRSGVNLVTEMAGLEHPSQIARSFFIWLSEGAVNGEHRGIISFYNMNKFNELMPHYAQGQSRLKPFLRTEPFPAQIGLLFSFSSLLCTGHSFSPTSWLKDKKVAALQDGTVYRQPYNVAWLTDYDSHLPDFSRFKCILDCNSTVIDDGIARKLVEYVRGGGIIFIYNDTGTWVRNHDGRELSFRRDFLGGLANVDLGSKDLNSALKLIIKEMPVINQIGVLGDGYVVFLDRGMDSAALQKLLRTMGEATRCQAPGFAVDGASTTWFSTVKYLPQGNLLHLVYNDSPQALDITCMLDKRAADRLYHEIISGLDYSAVAKQRDAQLTFTLQPFGLAVLVEKEN